MLIRHNREGDEFPEFNKGTRSTVVLEKPHVLEILQEMRKLYTKSVMSIPTVTLNIGAALCHHKDSFNKRLGVKMATERVKPVVMNITSHPTLTSLSESVNLLLTGIDSVLNVQYSITVKIYRDSGDLRVISAHTRKE